MFFHPGSGYKAKGNIKLCESSHTRNFIVVQGDLVLKNGQKNKDVSVGFWGEWSSHAEIEKIDKEKFFKPFFAKKCDCDKKLEAKGCKGSHSGCSRDRCDTDPFVFGDRFCYVNCQQERSRMLCNLPAGSIILFGSRKNKQFVLDTVFVVEDSIGNWLNHKKEVTKLLGKDFEAYNSVSLKILEKNVKEDSRRFYLGATYKNFERPFSFVPALEQKSVKKQFNKIELTNSVFNGLNPRVKFDNGQTQGFAVLLEGMTEVKKLWKNVRNCVLNNKCVLGVNFRMPLAKQKR